MIEYIEGDNARKAARLIATAVNEMLMFRFPTLALLELLKGLRAGRGGETAWQAVLRRVREAADVGLTARRRVALEGLATVTYDGLQGLLFTHGRPGDASAETTTAPREASARGRRATQQLTMGV